MTHSAELAVLLVAHGTVTVLEEMEDFLTSIRRGRAPTPELVAEMRHRYQAIGGSPLLATTKQQASALSERLGRAVLVGMRFGRPSIEQALADAEQLALRRLAVVPLAPYSVNLYFDEVCSRYRAMSEVSNSHNLRLQTVEPWGNHPGLVRAHADLIRSFAGEAIDQGAALVLTAHSLPLRVIEAGDAYAHEVVKSAASIGAALGSSYSLAYQSQGADGGRWLGPDLKQVVNSLAASGRTQVVVAPFGFLCDHVETLFDLDIELRAHAEALGIRVCRVPALGMHPLLIDTLVDLVHMATAVPTTENHPGEVCSC
jgi:protoporphyrin/coproporphyrin ferrochelatase